MALQQVPPLPQHLAGAEGQQEAAKKASAAAAMASLVIFIGCIGCCFWNHHVRPMGVEHDCRKLAGIRFCARRDCGVHPVLATWRVCISVGG